MKKKLPGTVPFVFRPAEEYFTGAEAIIDAGLLKELKPEAVCALHRGPVPAGVATTGQIRLTYGTGNDTYPRLNQYNNESCHYERLADWPFGSKEALCNHLDTSLRN